MERPSLVAAAFPSEPGGDVPMAPAAVNARRDDRPFVGAAGSEVDQLVGLAQHRAAAGQAGHLAGQLAVVQRVDDVAGVVAEHRHAVPV